ncbi:hypothetical protein [Luteolibacter soli]
MQLIERYRRIVDFSFRRAWTLHQNIVDLTAPCPAPARRMPD